MYDDLPEFEDPDDDDEEDDEVIADLEPNRICRLCGTPDCDGGCYYVSGGLNTP